MFVSTQTIILNHALSKEKHMPTTKTIDLVKWNIDHLKALHQSKEALGERLQVSIPTGWPQFAEAFALPTNEAETARLNSEWGGYFFINPEAKALVGSGGFHGEPDAMGDVEIGYEIASEYHNRGYGTQAARALMDLAFEHVGVRSVSATTLAEINASNRVLQKLGMTFAAEVDDAENGKLWRWQFKL